MHDTVEIVTNSVRIDQPRGELPKIGCVRWDDITLNDIHVFVAVWSTLLVPEPDHVTNLVQHGMEIKAGTANGNPLWLKTKGYPPNVGTATAFGERKKQRVQDKGRMRPLLN